jgi:hypothetical protein
MHPNISHLDSPVHIFKPTFFSIYLAAKKSTDMSAIFTTFTAAFKQPSGQPSDHPSSVPSSQPSVRPAIFTASLSVIDAAQCSAFCSTKSQPSNSSLPATFLSTYSLFLSHSLYDIHLFQPFYDIQYLKLPVHFFSCSFYLSLPLFNSFSVQESNVRNSKYDMAFIYHSECENKSNESNLN